MSVCAQLYFLKILYKAYANANTGLGLTHTFGFPTEFPIMLKEWSHLVMSVHLPDGNTTHLAYTPILNSCLFSLAC